MAQREERKYWSGWSLPATQHPSIQGSHGPVEHEMPHAPPKQRAVKVLARWGKTNLGPHLRLMQVWMDWNRESLPFLTVPKRSSRSTHVCVFVFLSTSQIISLTIKGLQKIEPSKLSHSFNSPMKGMWLNVDCAIRY